MGCKIIMLAAMPSHDDGGGRSDVRFEVAELPDGVRPEDVDYGTVAKVISGLDVGTRTAIAKYLESGLKRVLTPEDLENFTLISNVTLDDLCNIHKINREFNPPPELPLDDGFIILDCSEMKINGDEYNGMLVDGNGRKVVLIKSADDVKRFFSYMRSRESLNDMIKSDYTRKGVLRKGSEKEALLREFEPDLPERIDAVLKWRFGKDTKKTVPDLLLDFLDNAGMYEAVKYGGGLISSQRTLNNAVHLLTGDYYIRKVARLSDFEFEVYRLLRDKGELLDWKVGKRSFWRVAKKFNPEWDVKEEDFVRAGKERMEEYLFDGETGLLRDVSRYGTLGRAVVQAVTSPAVKAEAGAGAEVRTVPKSVGEWLRANWKELTANPPKRMSAEYRRALAGKDGKGLSYGAFQKLPVETRKGIIDGLKLTYEDGEAAAEGGSGAVRHKVKTRIVEDGDGDRSLRVYYDMEKPAKEAAGRGEASLTLRVQGMTLSKRFGIAYDAAPVLDPVDGAVSRTHGIVRGGMYNGRYVYSRYSDGRTEYYIMDDVQSNYEKAVPYRDLDSALDAIDWRNSSESLLSHAKMTPKQSAEGAFYRTKIEMSGLRRGERRNVTLLDYRVHDDVKFDDFFNSFWELVGKNGEWFHEQFDEECGTRALKTPEMCFTYLTEHFHDLFTASDAYRPEFLDELVELIKVNHIENKERYDEIVRRIAGAGHVTYRVDRVFYTNNKTHENDVALHPYRNEGISINLKGDMVGDVAVEDYFMRDFRQMASYISEKYGMTIRALGKADLEATGLPERLGFKDKVDAVGGFVTDGVGYVNLSAGDTWELAHEFVHLAMGVLRATDYAAYTAILDSMLTNETFLTQVGRARTTFPGMGERDCQEEALARVLSRRFYTDAEAHFQSDPAGAARKAGEVVAQGTLKDGAKFGEEAFGRAFGEIYRALEKAKAKSAGASDLFPEWMRGRLASDALRSARAKTHLIRKLIREGKMVDENC